jgi:hypothetical protein
MAISALRQPPQVTQLTGRQGAGACILPGAFAAATVVAVVNNGTGGIESSSFEKTLSQTGQIQQTSTANLSANEYWAIWFQ